MRRGISNGYFLTTTAAANRIRFLMKVCQLVSTMASPKQPQSVMGSVSASQNVNNVMITSMIRTILDTNLRRIAKSRQMPRINSRAESATDAESVMKSGT